jgi:mRNA interferase RelE/StbE
VIVEASEQFLDDIKNLRDNKIKQRLLDKIEFLESVQSLQSVPQIKKMKGFSDAWRIRIGDYRLGFRLIGDTIVLGRFLSRQQIYRFFP